MTNGARRQHRVWPAAIGLAMLVSAAGCVDQLPAQDLRILSAVPVDRVSVSLLWDDYRKDQAAMDRRYRGQAIVITGTKPAVSDAGAGARSLRFVLGGGRDGAVQAGLLDDQAEAILSSVRTAERVTLKCFCQGQVGKDVILRSCVAP